MESRSVRVSDITINREAEDDTVVFVGRSSSSSSGGSRGSGLARNDSNGTCKRGKQLSAEDTSKLFAVLKSYQHPVRASTFAGDYAKRHGESIKDLLSTRAWWLELTEVPGIYSLIQRDDKMVINSQEDAFPQDIWLADDPTLLGQTWDHITTYDINIEKENRIAQLLLPIRTQIISILKKYNENDKIHKGMLINTFEYCYEAQYNHRMTSYSLEWWVGIPKLSGVYYYLEDEKKGLLKENIKISSVPFLPIAPEKFTEDLWSIVSPTDESPLKILMIAKLSSLYIRAFGRPPHIDYKTKEWWSVLRDKQGVFIHQEIDAEREVTLICTAKLQLSYPIRTKPFTAPEYTQLICDQLNTIVEVLDNAPNGLTLKDLTKLYEQRTKKPIESIITQTRILSCVKYVNVINNSNIDIINDSNCSMSVMYRYTGPKLATSVTNLVQESNEEERTIIRNVDTLHGKGRKEKSKEDIKGYLGVVRNSSDEPTNNADSVSDEGTKNHQRNAPCATIQTDLSNEDVRLKIVDMLRYFRVEVTAAELGKEFYKRYGYSIRKHLLTGGHWWTSLIHFNSILCYLEDQNGDSVSLSDATQYDMKLTLSPREDSDTSCSRATSVAAANEIAKYIEPVRENIRNILQKHALSDPSNIGMHYLDFEKAYQLQYNEDIKSLRRKWFAGATRLGGIFYYLDEPAKGLTKENIRLSAVPFKPLSEENFRANLLSVLKMFSEEFCVSIFSSSTLSAYYIRTIGRPVHVDFDPLDWWNVLKSTLNVIAYETDECYDSKALIGYVTKLAYPFEHTGRSRQTMLQKVIHSQLRYIVEYLKASKKALRMKALKKAYEMKENSSLHSLISETCLLAYVNCISVVEIENNTPPAYLYREPVENLVITLNTTNKRYAGVIREKGEVNNDSNEHKGTGDNEIISQAVGKRCSSIIKPISAISDANETTKLGESIDSSNSMDVEETEQIVLEESSKADEIVAEKGIKGQEGKKVEQIGERLKEKTRDGESVEEDSEEPQETESQDMEEVEKGEKVGTEAMAEEDGGRNEKREGDEAIEETQETIKKRLREVEDIKDDLKGEEEAEHGRSERDFELEEEGFFGEVDGKEEDYKSIEERSGEMHLHQDLSIKAECADQEINNTTKFSSAPADVNRNYPAGVDMSAFDVEDIIDSSESNTKWMLANTRSRLLEPEPHNSVTSSSQIVTEAERQGEESMSISEENISISRSRADTVESISAQTSKKSTDLLSKILSPAITSPLSISSSSPSAVFVIKHLATLTQPGLFVSASFLNDSMRASGNQGLFQLLGSTEQEKWWVRLTRIEGIEHYFENGDRNKSICTMITYRPEILPLLDIGKSSANNSEVKITPESNEQDNGDFPNRQTSPMMNTNTIVIAKPILENIAVEKEMEQPVVIKSNTLPEVLFAAQINDPRRKRAYDVLNLQDKDSSSTNVANKKPRVSEQSQTEVVDTFGSSTPSSVAASIVVSAEAHNSSLGTYLISLFKRLRPRISSRSEITEKIKSYLDPSSSRYVKCDDLLIIDMLETLGDYFVRQKQFEVDNPDKKGLDDNVVTLQLISLINNNLQEKENALSNDVVPKLFASVRKYPMEILQNSDVVVGFHNRLLKSMSEAVIYHSDTVVECFYHMRVFPYSELLKQVLLLLGKKLGQYAEQEMLQGIDQILNAIQYSKIMIALKEISAVDFDIANLLRRVNALAGLPLLLNEMMAQYRQWGNDGDIASGGAKLAEMKFVGKGIIKMMNSYIQSSNEAISSRFSLQKNVDMKNMEPLLDICLYLAVKLSALTQSTAVADEDLVVYILQSLRGQNTSELQIRILIDNLVKYARLLKISDLKEKFCQTIVVFIAHMENYSSDYKEVESLLGFFEAVLAQYRTLPATESSLSFDAAYLAKATKYLYSPSYMRNALRNLSTSSYAVMKFVVQLDPWLNDYPNKFDPFSPSTFYQWDLDQVGFAYLGFRRLRDPFNLRMSAGASEQEIAFIRDFPPYIERLMSIPFGKYEATDRFIICISKCLTNIQEGDKMSSFILRELSSMLQKTKENVMDVDQEDILSAVSVAGLMQVLGERKKWSEPASLGILSSLSSLMKSVFDKEKTIVRPMQMLPHYLTMLSSFRNVAVVNEIVISWLDSLLHLVFRIVTNIDRDIEEGQDLGCQFLCMTCFAVMKLVQASKLMIASALDYFNNLNACFVNFATVLKRMDQGKLQCCLPSFFNMLNCSGCKQYLDFVTADGNTVPSSGIFEVIKVAIQNLLVASRMFTWHIEHVISVGYFICNLLPFMSSRKEIMVSLLVILSEVFPTICLTNVDAGIDKSVEDQSLDRMHKLIQEYDEVQLLEQSERQREITLDLFQATKRMSDNVRRKFENQGNSTADMIALASRTLKLLSDSTLFTKTLEVHEGGQIRQSKPVPQQLREIVLLCLSIFICYLDDLQVGQWRELLFFYRHYTKQQIYFSAALRRTILHLLEHCTRKAIIHLESCYSSFCNHFLAEVDSMDTNLGPRSEDGQLGSIIKLLQEENIALLIETTIIMHSLGKTTGKRLAREKKALQVIYEHFYNGCFSLPSRVFHLLYDYLDISNWYLPSTRHEKDSPMLWRELQDSAVSYLQLQLLSNQCISVEDMREYTVLHGLPCRIALPISVEARMRSPRLQANSQGTYRRECTGGELWITCTEEEYKQEVWLCVDILPKGSCVSSELPRYFAWNDAKHLEKLMQIRYAAVLVDTVGESRATLKWKVEKLMDQLLATAGLLTPSEGPSQS